MPVQWVNRPDLGFPRLRRHRRRRRRARRATRSSVLPSGRQSRGRAHRHRRRRSRRRPNAGQAVTLDARRRDRRQPRRRDRRRRPRRPASPTSSTRTSLWMGEQPLLPGRPYLLKHRHAHGHARTITALKHKVDVNTLEHARGQARCELNEIGVCNLELDQPVAVRCLRRQPRHRRLHPHRPLDQRHRRRRHARLRAAPRRQHRTGRRSTSTRPRARALKDQRAVRAVVHRPVRLGQVDDRQPASRSELHALGRHTYLLDGDNVRHGPQQATSASPMPTASRTSAAWPRSRG